jgi:carboxymethylenebutenolidase
LTQPSQNIWKSITCSGMRVQVAPISNYLRRLDPQELKCRQNFTNVRRRRHVAATSIDRRAAETKRSLRRAPACRIQRSRARSSNRHDGLNPLVNKVIGGDGREEVYEFYAKHFLHQIPPDMEFISVSRTIGQGRVVDEIVGRFTHTISIYWMLPGLAPTGKRVEVGLVRIVQFDGDKLAHEHCIGTKHRYWCSSTLLESTGLPIVGGESARSVLDRSLPLNALTRRSEESMRKTDVQVNAKEIAEPQGST